MPIIKQKQTPISWDCIEDPRRKASRVWLSREKLEKKIDGFSATTTAIEQPWIPLRKVDSDALNLFMEERTKENFEQDQVHIDGGRATAYPLQGTIKYNFISNAPTKELTSSLWFVRENDSNNSTIDGGGGGGGNNANNMLLRDSSGHAVTIEKSNKNRDENIILQPMSFTDGNIVEELYQRAAKRLSEEDSSCNNDDDDDYKETSDSTATVDQLLKERYTLSDDTDYSVIITKRSSRVLSIKKKQKGGWRLFSTSHTLQRGYFPYTVDGEEEEMMLGPVNNLVFVIHGIGEAMWSRDDINQSSIVHETNSLRTKTQKLQVNEWKKQCNDMVKRNNNFKTSNGEGDSLSSILPPKPPNRIEFIPIQWYDVLHGRSPGGGNDKLMDSLSIATLKSIPALRSIANDVILDVLLYLKPKFCHDVLLCVVNQINDMYNKFQIVHNHNNNTKIIKNQNGRDRNSSKKNSNNDDNEEVVNVKFSLIGHSLGSVIAWDILCLLKQQLKQQNSVDFVDNESLFDNICCWGPTLSQPLKISSSGSSTLLPFIPEFTLFLGSPIGLFLTIRGAHDEFNKMRLKFIKEKEELEKCKKKGDSVLTNNGMSVVNMYVTPSVTSDVNSSANDGDENDNHLLSEIVIPSPFTLPSSSIYNIFHPSDPVAYRIEPLLLSQEDMSVYGKDCIPAPLYLVNKRQGLKIHIKAMQISDEITKSFVEHTNTINSFISSVTEQATNALLLDGKTTTTTATATTTSGAASTRGSASIVMDIKNDHDHDHNNKNGNIETAPTAAAAETTKKALSVQKRHDIRLQLEKIRYPLGGEAPRIDYMLQTGVIDNEYISAVTAHSSYFTRSDILELIMDLSA